MSKAQLYRKIHEVMKDIEYLQKDDKVSVGQNNSYKAISEEKVTMAVRDSLIKHGLIIMPIEQEHTRDPILGRDGEPKGFLTTVNTKYEICDIETGESKIIVSSGTGVDTQDKGVGKAMTYAYKYLLLRTFGIPTGDDPDKVSSADWDEKFKGAPATPTPPPGTPSAPPTAASGNLASEGQVKMLNAKATTAGYKSTDKAELMTEVSRLIGRQIDTFAKVEKGEVNTVAQWLDAQKAAS